MALSFEQFAPEVLEEILASLHHPRDLGALAATSKHFYKLVIPDHFEFRYIRCDPYRISLWKAIVARPLLASNIHTLEVVDELEEQIRSRPVVIPWTLLRLFEEQDRLLIQRRRHKKETFDWFKQALSLMRNLTKVKWMAPTLANDTGFLMSLLRDVKSPVQELQIQWSQGTSWKRFEENPSSEIEQLRGFEQITHFSMNIEFWHFNLDAVMPIFSDVLGEYTALTALCLQVKRHGIVNLAPLFIGCHWPRLKHLTLEGQICLDFRNTVENNKTDILKTFFSLHRFTLETLRIEDISILPRNSLALPFDRLHSVWFNKISAQNIENILPPEFCRKLAFLHPSHSGDKIIPFHAKLPELRALSLSSPAEVKLLKRLKEAYPKLERLMFYRHKLTTVMPEELNEFIKPLQDFKDLTHLGGFLDNAMNDTPILHELVGEMPRLKFVEVGRQWVEIERHVDGIFKRYQHVKDIRRVKMDVEGEFFIDVQL